MQGARRTRCCSPPLQCGIEAMAKLQAIHAPRGIFGIGTIFIRLKPTVGVHVSPDQNHLLHGEGEIVASHLRKMADAARALPPGPRVKRAASQKTLSGIGPTQTGQDVEQCALAGTVQSHQHHKLAAIRGKSHGVQNGVSRLTIRDVPNLEQRAHGRCSAG
jgi:hypothetical protein